MRTLILSAALLAASAGAAQAHAHLKSSDPAKDAAVASPRRIVLTFTEGLVAQFSTFELSGPAGPAPVKVKAAGATLTGEVGAKLPPGVYEVRWRAVADDTHHSAGQYGFTVK